MVLIVQNDTQCLKHRKEFATLYPVTPITSAVLGKQQEVFSKYLLNYAE